MNNKPKSAAHVVFGLDKDGKPRAALVHPADLVAVTKAAASLGFKIGRADSPQGLQIAKQLPDAKVFATGKGLIPLVRKDIMAWLEKGLASVEAKAQPVEAKDDPAPSPTAPNGAGPGNGSTGPKDAGAKIKPDPKLWQQLAVGAVVIAPEKNTKADGYWPARVTAVKGDHLVIQWLDFPKQPPLTVKRRSVALLLDHS